MTNKIKWQTNKQTKTENKALKPYTPFSPSSSSCQSASVWSRWRDRDVLLLGSPGWEAQTAATPPSWGCCLAHAVSPALCTAAHPHGKCPIARISAVPKGSNNFFKYIFINLILFPSFSFSPFLKRRLGVVFTNGP